MRYWLIGLSGQCLALSGAAHAQVTDREVTQTFETYQTHFQTYQTVEAVIDPMVKIIDAENVKFRLLPRFNLQCVFGLPAYGPPECGFLKAKAQSLATAIIAASQGTHREIMAA